MNWTPVLITFLLAPPLLGLEPIERVAALIDPVKLATLAPRGANPRVQKYVAQLHEARVVTVT